MRLSHISIFSHAAVHTKKEALHGAFKAQIPFQGKGTTLEQALKKDRTSNSLLFLSFHTILSMRDMGI